MMGKESSEFLKGRATERADVIVWLLALADGVKGGTSLSEAFTAEVGCEANEVARIFTTAANMVSSNEHVGCADEVGSELLLVFDGNVTTADCLKYCLYDVMEK